MSSTNRDRQTALHIFCIRRNLRTDEDRAILKLLFDPALTPPLDVNAVDRWGKSALIYATGLRKDTALIRQLIDVGHADIFIEDHVGFTALTYAYNCHNEQLVKLFVDKCNAMGREMVVLETQLNANFLSYLKIQKLVGADRASVAIKPHLGTATSPDSSASASTSPRLPIRRLSKLGGRFINLLSPTLAAHSPIRRRRSSLATVMTPLSAMPPERQW